MGTRNLTMVVADGQTRVAQYGQWDGYPEGQGATALKFLRETNLPAFREKVLACRFGTEEEIDAVYEPYTNSAGWMTSSQSDSFQKSEWAYLSRDRGAEILEIIMQSPKPLMLNDSSDFAADSLFCEWAYVIDLDQGTFEVYKGFNHDPLPSDERFAHLRVREKSSDGTPYYPVRHLITFKLSDLPAEEEFLKAVQKALPPDEEAA